MCELAPPLALFTPRCCSAGLLQELKPGNISLEGGKEKGKLRDQSSM